MFNKERQEQQILTYEAASDKARRKWRENVRNGVWQPACDKPDFRTDKEIEADFLEGGFQ